MLLSNFVLKFEIVAQSASWTGHIELLLPIAPSILEM